jgi:hypothetical protein
LEASLADRGRTIAGLEHTLSTERQKVRDLEATVTKGETESRHLKQQVAVLQRRHLLRFVSDVLTREIGLPDLGAIVTGYAFPDRNALLLPLAAGATDQLSTMITKV